MRCLLFALLVIALASPVLGQTTITCEGLESGGDGIVTNCPTPHQYAYDVTIVPGGISDIFIGTGDGNIANYTNICLPPFWTVTIDTVASDHYYEKTPHGGVSTVTGACPYVIHFNFTAGIDYAPSLGFAFDHDSPSHDVDWRSEMPGGFITSQANWAQPVGLGAGPVHAPGGDRIPTLSTYGLILLTVVLLAVATFVIRRRRRVEA